MSLHEDLKAYLDGELDSSRMDEIRIELDRDAELRREYEQLRLLSAEFASQAVPGQSEGLERTLAALQIKRRPLKSTRIRWIFAGSLVAAAAIAVLVTFTPTLESLGLWPGGGYTVASGAAAASMASPDRLSQADTTNGVADKGLDGKNKSEVVAEGKAMPAVPSVPKAATSATVTVAPETETRTKLLDLKPRRFASIAKKRTRSGALAVSPPTGNSIAPSGNPAQWLSNSQTVAREEVGNLVNKANTSNGVAPQQVVLSFASSEAGEKSVVNLLAQHKEISGQIFVKTAAGKVDVSAQTIIVDVPEANADQLIAQLKALPNKPATAPSITKFAAQNTVANAGARAISSGSTVGQGGLNTKKNRPVGGGADDMSGFGGRSGGFGGGVQTMRGKAAGVPGKPAKILGETGKTPLGANAKAPSIATSNLQTSALNQIKNLSLPANRKGSAMQSRAVDSSKKAANLAPRISLDGVSPSGLPPGATARKPAMRRITIVIVKDKAKTEPVP